jgi:hypothetical protein
MDVHRYASVINLSFASLLLKVLQQTRELLDGLRHTSSSDTNGKF